MKLLFLVLLLTFSQATLAMNLTKKLQVISIKYNEEKKNYDISFSVRAGIYNSDESHLKCLQESIEKKIEVKVEFVALGLKIVKCNI